MEYVEEAEVRELSPEKERNNRIINACVAYLIAYVGLSVFFHFITGFLAYKFYLHPKLYYFKIEFLSNFEQWTIERVNKTFAPSLIIFTIIGVSMLLLQRTFKKRPGLFKMIMLWIGIHALNTVIVHVLLSPMEIKTSLNMTMLTSYQFWDDQSKLTLSVFSLFFPFIIGNYVAKPFVQLANTTQLIHKNISRITYLFQIVVIPFLLGTLVQFIYFAGSESVFNAAYAITMFTTVFSIFIYALRNKMIMVYRLPESPDINNKLLVGLILFMVILKLSPLNTGLVLYLE
jgi:hypothetical protein